MKKILASFSVLALALAMTPSALAASPLGNLSETISVGRTISIGLNVRPEGPWRIGRNTAPSVVKAVIGLSGAEMTGLKAGTAAIDICTGPLGNCIRVDVTVTSGNVLGQMTGAHPAGSWVLEGTTVYYVHSSGLIPIPTWNIFLDNGGKSDSIIPATQDDLQLPLLPLMEMNDSRVQ